MISTDFLRFGYHRLIDEFRLISLNVLDVTQTSVVIDWAMTEVCSGQVEWGLTSAYAEGPTDEQDISGGFIAHAQTISGLDPGIQYHFRIKSTSAANITVVSADNTFMTAGVIEPPPPTEEGDVGPRTAPAIPTGGNVFNIKDASPSIPHNTNQDVGGAISAWVNSKPPGSILVFDQTETAEGYEHMMDTPHSTYRMGVGVNVTTDDKELCFRMVKSATRLIHEIEECHLTDNFDEDFLGELSLFARMGSKRGIPQP